MNISIRLAQKHDAENLTEMIMRSKGSNGYDENFLKACRDELSVSPTDMLADEYWIAEDGEICGCACLRVEPHSTNGEISSFFIDPKWQRKGIGWKLWDKIHERALALGLKKLQLDSDPFAVPFYQAIGFTITGQTPSGSIPGRTLPQMTRLL